MILKDIFKFADNLNGKIYFDYNIKRLNWFNIGGKTKIFFQPESLKELIDFLKLYNQREKIFIIGAGSNVLISDQTFNGVIIKLGKKFENISKLDENTIIAGGNVLDKKVSLFCEELGIGGLEFLSCIPGTVAGGIIMNSGCYKREFKNIVTSVQVLDFSGNLSTIHSKNINFNYRSSNLSKNLIILSATLKGEKTQKKTISNKIKKLLEVKKLSQPSKVKTGGSTFKNPINFINKSAWELINLAVPKNTRFGDAEISDYHSNFFVNKNNATFDDMFNLINFVKNKVKKKFNINLELEIKIIN